MAAALPAPPPPAGRRPPRAPAERDRDRLQYAMQELCGIDQGVDWHLANVQVVLAYNGVHGFMSDFLSLAAEDIMELDTPPGGVAINRTDRRKMVIMLAYYHWASAQIGKRVSIIRMTRASYDTHRINIYSSTKPIIPWDQVDKTDKELENWKKSVKISYSDYTPFKDESQWTQAKEKFEGTVESHALEHLLDDTHVPSNKTVYEHQCRWLYKAMKDNLLTSACKSIVNAHKDDKDVCQMWKEIRAHYDMSITAEIRAQTLSTYITSTRLNESGWRGTQANFIQYFSEQTRLHNEIAEAPFTDAQQCNFMQAAVAGTDNLATVWHIHRQTRMTTGAPVGLTFSEYKMYLLEQAATHDAANTSSRNPRFRREANTHGLSYDEQHEDAIAQYEANVHDIFLRSAGNASW